MPSNSHQWLDQIMVKLFAPETRRIDKMVESLTERNSKLVGKTTYGFMHMGEVFVSNSNKHLFRALHGVNSRVPVPPLSPELSFEVSAFIVDAENIKKDKDRIRQVLFKLIFQANSKQEIRDALPECVAQVVDDFKGMPRTMNRCTFLIESDWRAVRDYEKMLPKIEFYAMTALIY